MALTAPKMHPRAKLPIINPPKVWVCGSPYVDRNEKLMSAIMKNQKNGSNAPKMHPRAKLPIINLPKVWVCSSLSVDRNGKLVSTIMKNQKNGSNSPKCILEQKSQLLIHLRFGSAVFCVDGNERLVSAIMKNQKNGSNSPKMRPRARQCQTHM